MSLMRGFPLAPLLGQVMGVQGTDGDRGHARPHAVGATG